jgi:2,3-bisphosphoglycerate-dependent phosphoglycerate mutase
MARIFIFRHGETYDNKHHDFSGFRNVDLNEQGISEAQKIKEALKDEQVTKAYQSDLLRSQRTLEIVLEGHENVEVITDARIKERDYGDLTGLSKEKIEKGFPELFEAWHRSYDIPPPKGESIKDVEKRVLEFLADFVPTWRENDVIFISAHGNSIRPMRRYFEKISQEEMCTYENVPGKIYEYTL